MENNTHLINGNKRILYFAPTNRVPERLRKGGNSLVTTDLEMLDVNVKSDITSLPFASNTFDLIICSHVLEHVVDDCTAMSELYRVLVPGGNALILVPKDGKRKKTYEDDSITSDQQRRQEFGTKYHVRLYGRDVIDRLTKAGFDVSVENYSSTLPKSLIYKYSVKTRKPHLGRVTYSDIHRCKKPIN